MKLKNLQWTRIITTLIVSLQISSAFAEDKIVFRPVTEDTEMARAVCRSKRRSSDSMISKQSQRFRGYLDPHQVRDLSRGRQRLEIPQLVSAANAIAFGGDTMAEVQVADISIEIKSISAKPISEIVFRWSRESPRSMTRLSESDERFSFVDQGTPSCRVSGPSFSSETCLFDAAYQAGELLSKHIKRLGDERFEIAQKSMSQGLMIEVVYRSQSYAGCVGRSAQAIVRTRSSHPILKLVERE